MKRPALAAGWLLTKTTCEFLSALCFVGMLSAITLAILLGSSATAFACSCCDGGNTRRVIGWSARGAALVENRENERCEDQHSLEVWRRSASEPVGCFDLFSDNPNARVACNPATLVNSFDTMEEPGTVTDAARLRRTSRRRFFPIAPKQLHPNYLKATVEPHVEAATHGPDGRLRVMVLDDSGQWQTLVTQIVSLQPQDDLSGERPHALGMVEIRVFPTPDRARAMVAIDGQNTQPGSGYFPTEMRWVELPSMATDAFVDRGARVAALPSAQARWQGARRTRTTRARYNREGLRLHRRGEFAESARKFTGAIMHEPSAAMPRFNLACASARLGMREQALHLLEGLATRARVCTRCAQALRLAARDPDLANLRSDPRFQSAIAAGSDDETPAARPTPDNAGNSSEND